MYKAKTITTLILYLLIGMVDLIACESFDLNNEQYEEEQRNCVLNILNTTSSKITTVNLNNYLLKALSETYKYNVIIREYLSIDIGVPNEVYLLEAEEYELFISDIEKLRKDFYWNPRAPFLILANRIKGSDMIDVFKKLHSHFVFDVIVIRAEENVPHIVTYNFKKSDQCTFNNHGLEQIPCPTATTEDILKNRKLLNVKTLRSHRRSEVPYSGCFLKIFLNPLKPYNFNYEESNNGRMGCDEAFYRTVGDLNIYNFTLIHSSNTVIIGTPNTNYTVNGVMKMLEKGTVDVMVGGIILSRNRIGPFDFIYPHSPDRFLVFLPRSGIVEKWKAMFYTFSSTVWSLIFLCTIVTWSISFVVKVFGHNKDVSMVLLAVFGYFVGSTHKVGKNDARRLVIVFWTIFTWSISCFYQSNLTSVFTTPQNYPQIETLEELVKMDYKLYLHKVTYNYLKVNKVFIYNYGVVEKSIICEDRYECLEKVAEGGKRYTVLTEIYYLYYQYAFKEEDGTSKFHILDENHQLYMTSYMRKGHPDIERIRYLQSIYICSGLYIQHFHELAHNNSLKYVFHEVNSTEPLMMKDVEGLYFFYLLGMLISLLVFIAELLYKLPSRKLL